MAENIVELLTDVADAIREKKGSNEPINAQNFANEIKNLPSGGDVYAFGETMESDGKGGTIVKTVIVKDGVVEIEMNALQNLFCVEVILPNTLEIIGQSAFYNCSKLSTIALPNSVVTIREYCFRSCTSLASLRIPPKVTAIKNACFMGASKLAKLILSSNQVVIFENTNAFSSTPIASGTGYIYVPDDLVDAYKGATNWSTYASQIKGLSELPQE